MVAVVALAGCFCFVNFGGGRKGDEGPFFLEGGVTGGDLEKADYR